jgi:hypothetical protein
MITMTTPTALTSPTARDTRLRDPSAVEYCPVVFVVDNIVDVTYAMTVDGGGPVVGRVVVLTTAIVASNLVVVKGRRIADDVKLGLGRRVVVVLIRVWAVVDDVELSSQDIDTSSKE